MATKTLSRAVTESLAVLGAVAGLWVFATVGAFESGNDDFPRTVMAPDDHGAGRR